MVTGCAAQVDPAAFAAMAEVDHVVGNQEKTESFDVPRARARRHRAGQGQRHHVGARDRRSSGRRLRRPGPRLCADPKWLRSPLHLLHHSLRPRPVALGSRRRGGGAGADAGRERLCRDRAHRRRHHRLWRRPSRRPHPRQAGAEDPQARAGAQAAQAVVDRLDRGRRRADDGDRRRGAADAASSPLACRRATTSR